MSDVTLAAPIPLNIITMVIMFIGVSLFSFFAWGSFTKTTTVQGRLDYDLGSLVLKSSNDGVIREVLVEEREQVSRGDVLFVVGEAGPSGSEVICPVDGVALDVRTRKGQIVTASSQLATIVPRDARLQANLYVSAAVARRLRVGDDVSLSFREFPYQQFGFQSGTVLDVRKSVPSRESPEQSGVDSGTEYVVAVNLASGGFAYGAVTIPFEEGMVVEARLPLEKRRLYRWVFGPLLGVVR
jgi:multidrug resistance efflux pump